MVVYECDICFKKFTRKGDYDRHLNKKNPCQICSKIDRKIKIYKCDGCKRTFNRCDSLTRHIEICTNHRNTTNISTKNKTIENNRNTLNNGIINRSQIINGDNNTITINYLYPFGKDGIDDLTTPEKIAIFRQTRIQWK